MTRLGDILRSLADKVDGAEGRLDALEDDSGWESIFYIQNNINIRARRVGKMVTVSGRSFGSYMPATTSWRKVTTLPERFRPGGSVFTAAGSTDSNNVSLANIEADGVVYIASAGGTVDNWGFIFTYPVG